MIDTISGNNSLLAIDKNLNRVNNTAFNPRLPKDFFQKIYLTFFENLKTDVYQNNSIIDFCEHWYTLNKNILTILSKKLKSNLNNPVIPGKPTDKNRIDKIVNKVRGNIGEIFVEGLIKYPNGNMIDMCTHDYVGVDPNNEKYFDCTSIHADTKLPIHIQIKNFEKNVKIDSNDIRMIFCKTGDTMSTVMLELRKLNKDITNTYLEKPHQLIFSFTGDSSSVILKDLIEEYKEKTVFFGPEQINKLNIQNYPEEFFDIFIEEIKNKIL